MATDPERGQGLDERLRARINERGPISFAEFMEAALYDPEEGFYATIPVGRDGAFVTSPHVSPVFGRLVAGQLEECWHLLDRPEPFDVIELGAGDGTLADQILTALAAPARDAVRYTAVEVSGSARAALEARGFTAVASLDQAPGPAVGCVLANELFDNLPFHRLRGTPQGAVELLVGLEGDRFVLVDGPPSDPALAARAPGLGPGRETVASPAALDLLRRATGMLSRGYLWLFDYGFTDDDEPRSVHGYRDQRVNQDVLSDPGSTDITAGVDFRALAAHARSIGARTWGPVTQREALLALGFREWDERAQARQIEALDARRGIEALRLYSDRTRANLLLGRGGLGAFYVLCIGTGVGPDAPMSMRSASVRSGRASPPS